MRPRRLLAPTVVAPLAVVLAAAAQFAPALAGRVYRFEDIAGYFEPLWSAAARAMQAGRLPIWDGGAWSGQPLVGDPQAGIFYPGNWLWLALPVLRAYALAAALHAALAGLGMYALCRARGRSAAAGALAGISLGIGGYVVLQTRHIMFVECTAWLPWLALFTWRLLDEDGGRRRPLDLAGAAVSAGMLLLTGGVSMIYYGGWWLAALLAPRVLGGGRRGKLAGAGALCIAAMLGLLLAAPGLLPAAAHGRLSPRALGTEYDFAASVAWGGLHFIPSLFIPNLLGQDLRGTYVGGGTQWEIAGYYAGVIPFALAMYALLAGPRERRGERLALGAVLLLAVAVAPGARSSVHHLLYRVLPLYGSMRCPPRALYVFTLAVPLLGADGLDLLRARLEALLQRKNPVGSAVVQRSMRALAIGLPLLTAADLLITHRAENPTLTLAEARARAVPAAAGFLAAHPGERFVNDVHLRHDLHNSGLLFGADGASGYSSLPLWRYLHLLWIANHGRPYPFTRLHDDLAAQGIWRFESPLVDLLAVRWVLAPRGWDPHAPGYARRFDAPADAEAAQAIDVWENTEALPRAWLCGRARPAASPAEAAAIVAASHNRTDLKPLPPGAVAPPPADPIDLARGCVVEPDAEAARRLPLPPPDPAAPPHEPAASTARPDALTFEARAAAPGARLVVFAEPFHPGWRATVDGAPAPVEVVDYALAGVRVPAGEHTVRITMTSPETDRGLALAAAAALCIAAIAAWGLVDARRRRRRGAQR